MDLQPKRKTQGYTRTHTCTHKGQETGVDNYSETDQLWKSNEKSHTGEFNFKVKQEIQLHAKQKSNNKITQQ